MNSNQVRQSYLDFFRERGHELVPSSSLVPAGDATLLFTNAGMNQFKDVFLGVGKRSYSRCANTQKCVRAGGKHNDLEEVGLDTTHHTFFEMLGNWSFGDYYKREAIQWAWELLTEVWGMSPDRLYASVYRTDDEAAALWSELTPLPPERIQRFDEKDNFWEMGETGPCGPSSEIHYDLGPEACHRSGQPDHQCRVNGDCNRIVEIWNLVFIQHERLPDGSLQDLPARHVDTGMGFERVVTILQNQRSNYDTDLFQPLLGSIQGLASRPYGQNPATDMSIRVVADHVRALTFLLTDGVLPANDGRGYVVRRILRRALRHGTLLGLDRPFLHGLTPLLADQMGGIFPELLPAIPLVERVVRSEEERFIATLRSGGVRLDEIIDSARQAGHTEIDGTQIFQLYDTYGYPPDLAADALREQGLSLDQAGYDEAMEEQRSRARAAWKGAETRLDTPYRRAGLADRDTPFEGYRSLELETRILALFQEGEPVDRLSQGEDGEVILEKTPFYAEAGGQVSDGGALLGEGAAARVTAVHRPHPELVVQQVRIERGTLEQDQAVKAQVALEPRLATARNHTATHLLHAALRAVLGGHVKQAGSLVAPDRLRFDFTHFAATSIDELRRVLLLANEWVIDDHPLEVDTRSLEDAMSAGAMALFGEKYGEEVRVVQVPGVSLELCGGTHVTRTGQIGPILLTGETSISAGMRRIEAVTGRGALDLIRARSERLEGICRRLSARPDELEDRIQQMQDRTKELEREVTQLRQASAQGELGSILDSRREIQGIALYTGVLEGAAADSLRDLADQVRGQAESALVVLASRSESSVLWIAAATRGLTDRVHAGKIVGQVARITGGGGGGRPDMAQAGGKQPDRIEEALEALPEILHRSLGGE